MKIVIFGGLGYIGSTLVELYRHETDCAVVVVDNRFLADRIAGFPPHVKFVHADVTDVERMSHILKDADLVFYLAAQVEAESSQERSEAVWRENFEVPKAIFEAAPAGARIVFPSSGNVFGGIPEGEKWSDLTEEDTPHPKLPYAETKHAVEQFLAQTNRDYVVLRFGTNYGYAPGARFNLVTNIFTKRALEGLDLKLHGGGLNWRPTASTVDCARALKFVATKRDASRELFHVSNASYRIVDLAETIVRIADTGAKIVNIEKEVPFNSYALSSEKIMRAGFEFEWPLERAVRDMRDRYRALIGAEDRA